MRADCKEESTTGREEIEGQTCSTTTAVRALSTLDAVVVKDLRGGRQGSLLPQPRRIPSRLHSKFAGGMVVEELVAFLQRPQGLSAQRTDGITHRGNSSPSVTDGTDQA